MSFFHLLEHLDWDGCAAAIRSCTAGDVEAALAAPVLSETGLMALLSPAAVPSMEAMAQRAHSLTRQRFGRVVGLFAPLYLSNECTNSCVYCGFKVTNRVCRMTLTIDQAEAEARFLHSQGFRHLLLVSGESPGVVTLDYLQGVVQRLRPLFASIAIEIYPMETGEYRTLAASGVDGLVVYQETYNRERYSEVHPAGRKRDFKWRLETPERGGEAGFRRLGIGALLGLSDWRTEAFVLARHARYLLKHFWRSHLTVSFPRLQPAAGGYQPEHPVGDAALVQIMTALRLFLPDAGLILSTRENPVLREHLLPLGVTAMSAGSRTDPGGYAQKEHGEEQFRIADERPAKEIADLLRRTGYEPVWKDWDRMFIQ